MFLFRRNLGLDAILRKLDKNQAMMEAAIKRLDTHQSILQATYDRAVADTRLDTHQSILQATYDRGVADRAEMLNRLATIVTALRLGYYNEPNEKVKFRLYFEPIFSAPDFPTKYSALINGLSEEDAAIVSRIVRNMVRALEGPDGATLDLFTPDEAREMARIEKEFFGAIVNLGGGLYAYGKYVMPNPLFEPQIFLEKMGYGLIEDRESVRHRDILDVGGFVGDSMLILSEWTERTVYVFEPDAEKYDACLETSRLNGITNARMERLALGAKDEELTFHISPNSAGSFFKREGIGYSGEITIRTVPLDSYVEGKDIDVGLIKVDIEGFERAFLEGAKKTIAKFRPVILLSIYHKGSDFFDLKPLIESWGLGYRFKIWKPANGKIVGETMLICEPPPKESARCNEGIGRK